MIPPNLKKAIKRIQYRDWDLVLEEGDGNRIAFYIDFSFWTIDTDRITDPAAARIKFHVHYPFILEDSDEFPDATEAQWILMIRSAIRSITLHEMDEFILVDGKQRFRPHLPDGTAVFDTVSFAL